MLLDNFYLFLPQFQIKTAHFSLVFPTYVQLCTQFIVICLEPFQKPTYLVHLKNSAQMLSSSMFTVFQVTNNWSPSMMDKSFKLHQKTKSQLWIIIKILSYCSISIRSNRVYGLFIFKLSYEDKRLNVSNIVWSFDLSVVSCTVFIVNKSIHQT